jgi:hypothetical protein
MKIKKGFMLREVAGHSVVVAVGKASLSFNGLIRLNDSGVILWNALENGGGVSELAAALTAEYDIDIETATGDAEAFIEKCRNAGILEE